MNRAEAFQTLDARKRGFLARIPTSASAMRSRYLKNQLEDAVQAAGQHLQAVYDSGLEVGPDLGPLEPHTAHPNYAFWLEGIRRHLQNAEAVLADQPDQPRS